MALVERLEATASVTSLPTLVTESSRRWQDAYAATVKRVDLLAVTMGAALATAVAFAVGASMPRVLLVSALVIAAWPLLLGAHHASDALKLGDGPEEFRGPLRAAVELGCGLAVVSWLLSQPLSRAYVLSLVVAVAGFDLLGRCLVRKRLHHRRLHGECMRRVLAVGHPKAVAHTVRALGGEPQHGLKVVGACLPTAQQPDELLQAGVASIGGYDNVVDAAELVQADDVAIVGAAELTGEPLRRLAWELEDRGISLIVSPGLSEVEGPRLRLRPTAGLSLLHVDPASHCSGRLMLKSLIDRAVAAVALVLLAPALLVMSAAVRLTSRGPALFKQERIGIDGKPFRMWKFRTMVRDAEQMRDDLLDENECDHMFKIRQDPRVTRVGHLLRRYSLDELPQLVNVVRGQMSLVGPRPPLADEVARYDADAHRRLRVRPGITGLWQVSGRADLTWEESLRLDLRYVDNWSLSLDMRILWKTGRAVLAHDGAY